MATIENNDLRVAETLSEDQANEIKGGIALLLPAVQAAREAARPKPLSASVESPSARTKN